MIDKTKIAKLKNINLQCNKVIIPGTPQLQIKTKLKKRKSKSNLTFQITAEKLDCVTSQLRNELWTMVEGLIPSVSSPKKILGFGASRSPNKPLAAAEAELSVVETDDDEFWRRIWRKEDMSSDSLLPYGSAISVVWFVRSPNSHQNKKQFLK